MVNKEYNNPSGVYKVQTFRTTQVKGDIVIFLYVDHHDFVYGKAAEIIMKWEREIDD